MRTGIVTRTGQILLFFLAMHVDAYAAERLIAPPEEKATCPRAPKSDSERNACEQLLKRYPDDADLYFNLGNFYNLKNDRNLARSWFNKGVQAGPSHFRTFNVIAILAGWDNDPNKGMAALDKAISINQRDPAPYINRGVLWFDKGEYDKAISDYSEAIRLDPKLAIAYNNRGNASAHMGKNDEALADYSEAIRLDPHDTSPFLNRGDLWRDKGDYNKAMGDYSEALRFSPKYAMLYAKRGFMWAKRGKLDRAFGDFDLALRLDPKLAEAHLLRGIVWGDQGDHDKELADYNEAIKLDPKPSNAYNNRGIMWRNKGDYNRAIADFSEAIMIDPIFANAYNNRGTAWYDKGEYGKAAADFSDAIKLKADNPLYFRNRGLSLMNSNKLQEAIADLQEAVHLDPKYGNAKESLQLALEKRRRYEKRNASVSDQLPASPMTTGGTRIALVIGNGNYKSVPALENPVRDAELLASSLKTAGFDSVLLKTNLAREKMIEELREFAKVAAGADWAVIYYAGHGIEVEGTNYMVPIDARPIDEQNISTQTVNLEFILNSVEVAKRLRLVILDACRDNPFAQKVRTASASRSLGGSRLSSIGKGLGRIEPEPGTLVVYAAKHGEFALDGEGQNSPFVEAVVRRIIQKPPIEVRRLFDHVREDVVQATKRQQQPFAYGSLSANDDFYFLR